MENERPTPLVDDPEATKAKLAQWFAKRLGSDGPVTIPELSIPEATGMSNVTLLFDVNYRKGGKDCSEAFVGRLQPEIERPVFPTYDLATQYHAMDIVNKRIDGVPAPDLMGLETDTTLFGTPFYIMRRIDGIVAGDMPPYTMGGWLMEDANPEERRKLWVMGLETMARFHKAALDTAGLGFDDFLEQPKSGETPLQMQLRYWEHYLEWAGEGRSHGICEPALKWLRDNQPENEVFGVSWGDSRIGNMMFAPDYSKVVGVLDWEMITLGNPLQDAVWWCFLDAFFSEGLGIPRLEGLPDQEESLAIWSKASGISAEHATYYEVFAGLRYGVILSRIAVAGGKFEEWEDNIATQFLRTRLERVGVM